MSDYKKLIISLLDDIKKMGKSRRDIERDLKYSDKYIDKAIYNGGSKKLANTLSMYKDRLEDQQNILKEAPAQYLTNKQILEYQKIEIDNLRAEKLKLLEEKQEMDKKIKRLENQVHMLLEANFKNTTSGKRRRSAL